MLVSRILKDKGDLVFTASPSDTIAAAAALLQTRRVGSMVVVDEGGVVVGILSERDIVRAVAEMGAAGTSRLVADWMDRDVVFASPGEAVQELLERMTHHRTRHLPVITEGRLIGIVSLGDLVKSKIAETEAEAEGLKTYISSG